ncbi:hypothetical protein [Burkholderia sp. Ac-20353]|uniref:hypothetical protein n=1 Tax=Burkholderia sp. Ac-20353 TaxID=2703894 RepID=UPI00197BE09B|nr:hypothetical protein [Burkholderia sp. Ac-20353]MBN3788294.1 hypothetical protein [Burkholderia sp. Ac-20353]
MNHNHVTSAGLPDRLTIDEAASLVVKNTGKPRDHVISYLIDCAGQGYFSADVASQADYENVSHISRIAPSKSTVSTAELIEWLNDEIEDAHQRAREAVARKETDKWGYPVKPEDVRVHLIPWSEQLDDLSRDETISMSPRGWIEYLAVEVAERRQWEKAERDAKLPTVRAEYLNFFGQLSTTLPLREQFTGVRWAGTDLPHDWLTRFHIGKSDLRDWAMSYAPEIAQARILTKPSFASTPDQNTERGETAPASQSLTAHTSAPSANAASPTWVSRAREIALEYIDRHVAKDLYPTQDDVASHAETECRARKILGPRGPLSAATIKRDAIQGDWWRENQPSKRFGKLGKLGQSD